MSTPRKQPRQQRSQFTFEAILDAAARLFERDGYKNTTTNKIAELAGVSIGTLYHYIPNKDALLYALDERHLRHNMDALMAQFAILRSDDPPLADTVRQIVTGLAYGHRDEKHLNRMLFLQAHRTPDIMRRMRDLEEVLATEVEYHLRRMNVGGPDPYLTALLVVQAVGAQIHGAIIEPPPGRTMEDCIDTVVDMWVRALETTSAPPRSDQPQAASHPTPAEANRRQPNTAPSSTPACP